MLSFVKNFSQKLEISCLSLFKYIFTWQIFGNRNFLLNLKFRDHKFNFSVDNRLDLGTLNDIFVKEEYGFKYLGNPKVIIDLGANIGDTAIFYSILYPQAKIFAVEPNPHIHEKLAMNVKDFPNIKICKCAISDTTGKIKLNLGDSHLGSSINAREQNKNSVEVDVYSLEDFCKMEGTEKVDILKFDIEGAEEYLLKSHYLRTNVVQMAGEMHSDLVSTPLSAMIDSLSLKETSIKPLNSKRYIIFGVL